MHKKIPAGCLTMLVTSLAIAVSTPAKGTKPLEDPIPNPIPKGRIPIALETVAEGLTAPNWGTAVPGCANLQHRLVVTDQDGLLWAISLATGQKHTLLDVSDRLVALGVGGPGTFDERGFLGMAFHPEFASNGLLYTYTSEPVDGLADFSTLPLGETANHQSVVLEWHIPEPCHPDSVVDPHSARALLRIDEPQSTHNAGTLHFGPDEKLYISLGDGGAADDQGIGHVPGGNGQDPSNILGTLIRIDPDGTNSANGQYGIPADNPFVGQADFLDEIFAYGFRNPFRFSFDSRTGALWIADVGQNDIEEIDVGFAGGNYGWRLKEGSFCFDPNGDDPGFVFECPPREMPADLIDPIAEYDHDEGHAVVGGFVYRGAQLPSLRGRYVFGDFFHPASGSGRLFYLEENQRIVEFPLANQENLGLSLLGFGQDAFGELYVLANLTGTPFEDTGVVLRIAQVRTQAPTRFSPQLLLPLLGLGQDVFGELAVLTHLRDQLLTRFSAHLRGKEKVPPVNTKAQGQAIFKVNRERTELSFKLSVANLNDVIAAHIHCAPQGVKGPIGVTLFSGSPVTVNGVLAQGTITVPDAGNACLWDDIVDVETAMRNDFAHINVHTFAHPPGEIRGQVR